MIVATVAERAGAALEAAADALAAAGIATPRLDAELLVRHAAGLTREELMARPETPLDPPATRELAAAVRRRVAREPVAYITGSRGFRRIEVAVDGRVLIPRPETELLVEVALELRPRSVLDVGTGSGAIALAIADELPDCRVLATDVSAGALEVAAANAEALGLAGRVELASGSLPADPGAFDLLVANLPYVTEDEYGGLEPEITRYEPSGALVAGPGGLEVIESLLGALALAPSRPAAVALEVGAGQAPAVAEMVRRAGWDRAEARRDLAGIERVVTGNQ